MIDDMFDVDRALEVLEGDAVLMIEPSVWQFVAWEKQNSRMEPGSFYHRGAEWRSIARTIPEKRFWRYVRAGDRIEAKFRREWRVRVPIDCCVCGQSFTRIMINQRRCTACVEAAKRRA